MNGENGLNVTSGVGLGNRLGSEPAPIPLRRTAARTVKGPTRRLKVASWLNAVSKKTNTGTHRARS